ncbi:hypothetical protein EV361DRAFT_962297 [Lentinula raphanica]|uniref:Uncharacterized protein n=1 Tax=Lentinula raphanica TaxID=153919 RepID=A0AA38P3C8_9AGAR|nr:hypothetical protein F5878DRAFT_627664 [Lentinula raphanica]KAJ3971811.1 hypothetical protein EV361DRAFT_962297 [Lentinula raphanica]
MFPYSPSLMTSNESRFERVSPALRALSKANVQLRQACLPFLFANIKIRHDRDAQKLRKYVTLFSRYTKLLFIDSNSSDNIGDPIIAQIVPQLKHLLHVEMPGRTWDKPVLLRAILSHPTVITVRVSGLLPKSNDDFSKVIFDHRNLWNPETDFFEQRLINGMKLSRLEIHSPHLLDTMPVDFGSRIFPGLEHVTFLAMCPRSYPRLMKTLDTRVSKKTFSLRVLVFVEISIGLPSRIGMYLDSPSAPLLPVPLSSRSSRSLPPHSQSSKSLDSILVHTMGCTMLTNLLLHLYTSRSSELFT